MTTEPASASHNILVISDLHLGEDIKPPGKTFLRHVAILERELEAFLAHYTSHRLDGRPWRLIVNGDMVDFLAICLLPRGEDTRGHDPEDEVWGLGTRPQSARAKMTRVLERHPGVFRAIARFVGAGNRVSIIVGNHDVEFHWPVVQETLKRGIARLWGETREAARAGAVAADEIEAGITFHSWFYFQENVVWVEHGHQYDDYCSFDYILNPVAPRGEDIVLSPGAAGARYVSNHVEGADPHQIEDWSMLGYVRWTLSLGTRGLRRIARGYAGMSRRLLSQWRLLRNQPGAGEAERRTHRERLRELALQVKLSEDTLVALDDLRKQPVIRNLGKLLMALMLDRLAVVVGATLTVLVLALVLPGRWAALGAAGMITLAWLASRALSRARSSPDSTHKLTLIPQRIRQFVRTPFVVFGHTHEPMAVKLDDGGWYFNTGTWVASDKPGLLRSFTHLLIRHAKDGPRAGLFQWRDGRSRAFGPEAKAL